MTFFHTNFQGVKYSNGNIYYFDVLPRRKGLSGEELQILDCLAARIIKKFISVTLYCINHETENVPTFA